MVLREAIFLPLLLLAVVLSYLNIQKKNDISHSHDLKHIFSDTAFKRDGIVGSRRQLRLRSLMQQPLVQRLFSSQAMDDSKDALSSNFVKISTPEYNEVETSQRTLSRRLSELTDFEADMCEHLRPDVNKRSLSFSKDFGDPRNVEFKAYHQNLLPKEKGLRLLMMGDSITRYMYLSLTYYLSHGMWYSEIYSRGGDCYLVSSATFADFPHFLRFGNSVVGPYAHENCDCRRDGPTTDNNYENRFFYDERNENSVAYFQSYPFTHVHSRLNASDAFLQDYPLEHMLNELPSTFTGDWPTFISDYASKLNPRPTHVIMNAGLHQMADWGNHANLDNIVSALKAANMVGIYMTTADEKYSDAEYEKYMCSKLLCLDMSFAYKDPKWDALHFYDETNVAANKMLLQMIEGNPNNDS